MILGTRFVISLLPLSCLLLNRSNINDRYLAEAPHHVILTRTRSPGPDTPVSRRCTRARCLGERAEPGSYHVPESGVHRSPQGAGNRILVRSGPSVLTRTGPLRFFSGRYQIYHQRTVAERSWRGGRGGKWEGVKLCFRAFFFLRWFMNEPLFLSADSTTEGEHSSRCSPSLKSAQILKNTRQG